MQRDQTKWQNHPSLTKVFGGSVSFLIIFFFYLWQHLSNYHVLRFHNTFLYNWLCIIVQDSLYLFSCGWKMKLIITHSEIWRLWAIPIHKSEDLGFLSFCCATVTTSILFIMVSFLWLLMHRFKKHSEFYYLLKRIRVILNVMLNFPWLSRFFLLNQQSFALLA